MPRVLITGSGGLIGSQVVRHFADLGWETCGIDTDARASYFGSEASVGANLSALTLAVPTYQHFSLDVRQHDRVETLIREFQPTLLVHAAAQPSHDYAATRPVLDFEVNAGGTLNLLEAVRHHAYDAAFVYLSTNKVYGDRPNLWPLYEFPTRYDHRMRGTDQYGKVYDDPIDFDESVPIDDSTHSLFGCSKLAADLYVQEYGRYFGMRTCCLRAGCLTGPAHAGAVQHGFLAYLAKCIREGRLYTVFGHKGKQVRDQLHARDVARACELFAADPRCGEVYNLGGGRANSISVIEAIDALEQAAGKHLEWRYDETARKGDHVCWISDTTKFRLHYPDWNVSVPLAEIVEELAYRGQP